MHLTNIFESVDCIDIFRNIYGASSIGSLKIYQLIPATLPLNPYEDSPLSPVLILDTECVSVKATAGRITREDYGITTSQFWRITVNGDIENEKLPLNSYAIITWRKQVIKGVISNVERKLTNRYYLYIDTSKPLPFTT